MMDFILYAFCFIWGSIYILFSEAVDRNLDEAKRLHDEVSLTLIETRQVQDDCQRTLGEAQKIRDRET